MSELKSEHLWTMVDEFTAGLLEEPGGYNDVEKDFNTPDFVARAMLDDLRAEVADLEATANLRHESDMRAIAKWQEATGKTLQWPGHDDLCVWLVERVAELEAAQEWQPLELTPERVRVLKTLAKLGDKLNYKHMANELRAMLREAGESTNND